MFAEQVLYTTSKGFFMITIYNDCHRKAILRTVVAPENQALPSGLCRQAYSSRWLRSIESLWFTQSLGWWGMSDDWLLMVGD